MAIKEMSVISRIPIRLWLNLIFAAVILAIGLLNLFCTRHDLYYFADHLSFFPRTFIVLWTLGAIGSLFVLDPEGPLFQRLSLGQRGKSALLAALGILAVLCVTGMVVWRTPYPTVHGDGAAGAVGYDGVNRPRLSIPHGNESLRNLNLTQPIIGKFRLQHFLHYYFTQCWPWQTHLHCEYNIQKEHEARYNSNQTWIFLCWICAVIALAGLMLWLCHNWTGSVATAAGLFLLAGTSPSVFLNGCGHYDSYIVPVLCMVLWFVYLAIHSGKLAPVNISEQDHRFQGVKVSVLGFRWSYFGYCTIGFILSALAGMAHPILWVTGVYFAIFLILKIIHLYGYRIHILSVLVLATTLSLLPVLQPQAFDVYFSPIVFLKPQLVFIKTLKTHLMNLLQVTLPILLCCALLLLLRFRCYIRMAPEAATALVMAFSSIAYGMTLQFAQGSTDELLYALVGSITVLAVLWLLRLDQDSVSTQISWRGAVLSVFLLVPHAMCYASPKMVTRFEKICPLEFGTEYMLLTPYVRTGLRIPSSTELMRNERLKMFWQGWENPLPPWNAEVLRLLGLSYYTHWCFEYDHDAEGTGALRLVFVRLPFLIQGFWVKGQCHTTEGRNIAYRKIREASHIIINENLKSSPSPALAEILNSLLSDVERDDP